MHATQDGQVMVERVLTKHGPLEEGMANHFSILALRTPIWKGKNGGRSQDGGGIGRGDHFLFYKFIERTAERWTEFTKQLLIASSGHQAPRKAAHCLRREVGQGYWRLKRETRERGPETPPRKGVLLEEVSNHQETLALEVRGKFSNLGGQPNWEEKLNNAHRLRA